MSAILEATDRLLAGPSPEAGAESLAAHNVRLGPLPRVGGLTVSEVKGEDGLR